MEPVPHQVQHIQRDGRICLQLGTRQGLLFNSTILPGAGLTHTHTESSQVPELLAAFCGEVKVSLSYNYKRLFMNLTASANGNIFLSDNLVFRIGNIQHPGILRA